MPQQTTWMDVTSPKNYPRLTKDAQTEVAIIGGGIAGILTGYMLARSGVKTILLEKDRIGKGAILYTTAFITQDLDTELSELIKMFGRKRTELIWDSHGAAVDLIESIVKKEKIDCDFMRCSLFTYANKEDQFKTLAEEKKFMDEYDAATRLSKKNDLNFPNAGYLELKNQAKFNPAKFLYALAAKAEEYGLEIFEKTEVQDIKGSARPIIKTGAGSIKARYSLISTYQPFKNPIQTFAKKGMYESHVFEVEIPKGLFKEATYLDMENPYHYFRIDSGAKKDRMIIGGEDHRKEIRIQKKSFKALDEYLKKIMGNRRFTIVKKWGGPILEPTDGLALIGEYKPNRLVNSAFSGNGMTYSAIAALITTDIVTRRKNPWIEIYNPRRVPTAKQLAYKTRDYGQEFFQSAGKNLFK